MPFQNSSHTALSCAEPFCQIKLKNVFARTKKMFDCIFFLIYGLFVTGNKRLFVTGFVP